jgi:predicted esterase
MSLQSAIRYPWTKGADCFVFLPSTRRDGVDQKHPVLCFLHGVGEALNGGSLEGVAAHQSPAWHADNRSALTAPFLTVCPQRRDAGRWTAVDAKNLHSLLDRVIEQHNGNDNRVFLTGFSYGGDGVFWFADYDRGDRFRKLWAVDPTLSPLASKPAPVPPPECPILIHYGTDAGQEMRAFIQRAGLLNWPTESVAWRSLRL